MAEVRRPSYNHVPQTPRIGGCTGAFFNLFDWNNTKRFASTKRLPAQRPEKLLGRSKSFRDDDSASGRGCSPPVKTVSYDEKAERGVISEDDASSRPPGLVARLMGLESLPEVTPSPFKHRRSQSFSGSELVCVSERENRSGRLALRDMLKQDHDESFETSWNNEILVVPVEYKNRQEKRVWKGDVETPIKTLVPYVDSPTGACRSVYALPYVRDKCEKSPFLARLHPSPVLQPSKCHNQMVSPAKTSAAAKKRASRFLEAAVKILEEISDNEQSFPRGREGMRSIAEFAASSPLSSGTDLLHCGSMSKIWNGSEDTESVGSRSNRSLMSRGSVSFRDSQRRDRICRDIFETSLSERAQSVSPPPRRPSPKGTSSKEVKGRRILRTQEAAVGDFKTDVRKASPGGRKGNSEANSKSIFTDSVQYLQQTATPVREMIKSLHLQATKISDGLEDNDAFTSDEESLPDQLASYAVTRKSKALGVDRSSLRKSPRKDAMSSPGGWAGDFRVSKNSRERIIRRADAIVPSPQLRTDSTSGSLHDGLRPIQFSRNRGSQQENALPVSSKRVLSTELSKSRSASSPDHSRRLTGQKDDLKLAARSKKAAPSIQEKGGRAAPELPAAPALQCHSPLPSAASLKRTRRKGRHGSPKLRESSGPSRSVVRRTPPRPYLHEERRDQENLEAKKSTRNPTAENDSERSLSNVLPDIAPRDSRNAGSEAEMADVNSDCRDENLYDTDEGLLQGLEKVEQIQGPARDLFPSPEIAQCNDLDEMLILGMEDLHWDDGMVEHQRENSSRARYCEIRASGESVQSICGALDEDICNVGNESSPSPQKFAGECSEADFHDENSAPVLMKRFLGKPLRLDVDMGETSPVSVLESPFCYEVSTTSESSSTEAEHRAASALEQTQSTHETVAHELECEMDQEEVSTPVNSSPIDKIRQAILDISSFTNRDQERASESNHGLPQTENTFVREVLSAAQLLSSPGRSPNWYERDLAVDPSLFEKLEGGETSCTENGDFVCESGGMWRCDRKLLFDCVNEAFSQNVRHFKDPQPWLRRPVLRRRSVRQKLVEEVQEKINGWRELASHAIDTLIDIDMSSRVGKWTDFSEEISEIGAEIEGMVWQVMVEEVVLELAGSLH